MKKKLFILPLLIFMSLTVTGCSFVSFKENTEMTSSQIEELNKERQFYINKLNSLSNESNYYQKELQTYRYLLREGVCEINETIDIGEMPSVYSKYETAILELKTIEQYEKERFENYQQAAILGILASVDLNDYREKEADEVSNLISNAVTNIEIATTYFEVDEYVRQFAIDLYEIKTDRELYEEELVEIKGASIVEVSELVDKSLYRENEQKVIDSLIDQFIDDLDSISVKEDVYVLQALYEQKIYEVKTDAELTHEERVAYAESVYDELLSIYLSIEEDDDKIKQKIIELEALKAELIEASDYRVCNYKYYVAKAYLYVDLAKTNDSFGLHFYKEYLAESLNYYLDMEKIDKDDWPFVLELVKTEYRKVFTAIDFDDVGEKITEARYKLDNLKQSEDMLVYKFLNKISAKYGDILELPENGLLVANNNFELGKIIDYYSFYQIDDGSFERDTFHIQLTYQVDNKDLKDIVFAYSELVQNSIEYTTSIDDNNVLTVKLTPHGFQTEYWINWSTRVNRIIPMDYSSGVEHQTRDPSFSNFAYKNNEKKVSNVWNSNQLWYAFEHGYYPICVEGSSASTCLTIAENLDRTLLSDSMDIEEKVYNLFDYFAKKSKNAWFIYWDVESLDAATKWNNLYRIAEGALKYHFGACQSFTRAFAILLGVEGIENRIKKSSATYGDDVHIDNLIKCSDGTHYLSNPHDALGVDVTGNYLSLLNSLYDNNSYKSVAHLYPDIIPSTNLSTVYQKIEYKNNSLLTNTLDEFKLIIDILSRNNEHNYVNIFMPTDIETSCVNYVKGLHTFNVISGTVTGINSDNLRNVMVALA